MKKVILLLGALLAVSATTMAEESGFIRTAVETGQRTFENNGPTFKYTDFILVDGYFKGETWGDFGLGYVSKKSHNEDNDHDGTTYVELRPEYSKNFSWGNLGGKLIIAQEKFGNKASGADMLKPEIFGTYNINPTSRVFARTLYSNRQVTGDNNVDNFIEAEVQYMQDIAGGTAGLGIYIAPGVDKVTDGYAIDDNQDYRLVGFYRKWWPKIALYTDFHADLRQIENNEFKFDSNAYRAGIYMSKPIYKGFVMEAEVNRFQEFNKKYFDGREPNKFYNDNTVMLGLRYAY